MSIAVYIFEYCILRFNDLSDLMSKIVFVVIYVYVCVYVIVIVMTMVRALAFNLTLCQVEPFLVTS